MRLPRIILNPAVAGWLRLLQRERRENARLRRELHEWQDKVLVIRGVAPIHTPLPKVEAVERPPIGSSEKRAYMARQRQNEVPSAELILEMADRAIHRSNGVQ